MCVEVVASLRGDFESYTRDVYGDAPSRGLSDDPESRLDEMLSPFLDIEKRLTDAMPRTRGKRIEVGDLQNRFVEDAK